MYTLLTPLSRVAGIGPTISTKLKEQECYTVQDFLLRIPLRYEDRSHFYTINDIPPNELVTIKAEVTNLKQVRRKKGKPFVTATVSDESGTLQLMWFNNNYVTKNLKIGQEYLFSGKTNSRGTMVQPTYESTVGDNLHTNRLVPLYTGKLQLAQGKIRRILKNILDNLTITKDELSSVLEKNKSNILSREEALKTLHFPDKENLVTLARERIGLEEILGLIQLSNTLKKNWQQAEDALPVTIQTPTVPASIPFTLTSAQNRCIAEILEDISLSIPMNRLLVGDVGSGKTVVAGCAVLQVLLNGGNAALVAPTKLLATQHAETIKKLFPDISIELLVGNKKVTKSAKPTFYIGTHSVINKLKDIQPGLIIYDEQHRFGVNHRSAAHKLNYSPHILTMTATPIPRTLLLTIFSHLQVSVIDELPANRKPTKTWVLTEKKRADSYRWLEEQIIEHNHQFQVIVVCPFINQSKHEGSAHVASAVEWLEKIKKSFSKSFAIDILHGKQKEAEKNKVIKKLYEGKLDILVSTSIVEVGVDLPQASAIIIESAEQFGMASLHQIRGRVGRAGQQGYCLLFTSANKSTNKDRLKKFAKTNNGQELAELDLHHRGAGDLFGTAQHGFTGLQFASWTDAELIHLAQKVYPKLSKNWEPLIKPTIDEEKMPLAN